MVVGSCSTETSVYSRLAGVQTEYQIELKVGSFKHFTIYNKTEKTFAFMSFKIYL